MLLSITNPPYQRFWMHKLCIFLWISNSLRPTLEVVIKLGVFNSDVYEEKQVIFFIKMLKDVDMGYVNVECIEHNQNDLTVICFAYHFEYLSSYTQKYKIHITRN